MNPVLYSSDTTSFETNGFGRMSDAISCKVTEERNGAYELVMVYPVNGIHFSDLSERMLLYAIHDDLKEKEPFRIYEITKPLNGQVTVRARHVSYDLNKIVVSPFTATSCHEALIGLKNHSSSENKFSVIPVNKDNVIADFAVEVPTAFRALLGGSEGSILDVYGPIEYKWEGWTLKVYLNRGQDTDVYIRYGKNLTELEDTINVENTFSAVYPFWKGQEEVTTSEGTQYKSKIVYISDTENQRILVATAEDENGNEVTLPLEVVPLDLSSEFEQPPTQTELRQKAETYLRTNTPWIENRNISVSFVALWQTEEYKHVAAQQLGLCDSVWVVHKRLGVKIKKKIVKVEYDVLNERYISMELGDTSKSFTSALKNEISTGLGGVKSQLSSIIPLITPPTEIQNAIDTATTHATELIRGGLGGHIEIVTNANGEPEEILIMEKSDKDDPTNKKMWRWNLGGLGYSSTGYNGTFTPAITSNGAIVADFITTGALTANVITAGVLSAGKGNTTLNMDTGRLVAKNLLIDTKSTNGSLEIQAKNFTVTPQGNVTLNNATLTNAHASGSFITTRTSDGHNYTTDSSAGFIVFEKDYERVARFSIWDSLYPLGTHSNLVEAFTLHLGDYLYDPLFQSHASSIPFVISTPPHPDDKKEDEEEYEYDWYYRFGVNDTSKRIGCDEWVYAESLYVTDHVRGLNNIFMVGTKDNNCELAVWGDLVVTGSVPKSRAVETENYGTVRLDAMESAASLFSDIGSGTIGEDGTCLIFFDPKFQETVDLSHEYQVFLTPLGKTLKVLSCEKHTEYFIVYGEPGSSFDWIVYAKQKEFSYRRLEEWIPPTSKDTSPPRTELEILADQYISDYEREVIGT